MAETLPCAPIEVVESDDSTASLETVTYERGDFNFIEENKNLQDFTDLIPILTELFICCEKNKFWDFFRDCPYPNRHGWIWCLPSYEHYMDWCQVKEKLCMIPYVSDDYLWFNFYTRLMTSIALEGWDDVENNMEIILTKIKKIYSLENLYYNDE